jgi:uncharacterized protein (DUF427 family)
MIRALLAGVTLAETDRAVMVDGNHHFPPGGVSVGHLEPTSSHSLCPWTGIASYSRVMVGDQRYKVGAWTYRHPSPLARRIKSHVAFWPPVMVEIDEPYRRAVEEPR